MCREKGGTQVRGRAYRYLWTAASACFPYQRGRHGEESYKLRVDTGPAGRRDMRIPEFKPQPVHEAHSLHRTRRSGERHSSIVVRTLVRHYPTTPRDAGTHVRDGGVSSARCSRTRY
ncbi:hypothetical protein MRX96_045682 [Rhipicephalus microplus]